MLLSRQSIVLTLLLFTVAGCSTAGSSGTTAITSVDTSTSDDSAHLAEVVEPDDGQPTRQACTSKLGSALTSAHGRLDGFLVAIVPPTYKGCNADTDHLHLQVQNHGAVYDIAVNVGGGSGVLYEARDLPAVGTAWSEGWHPNAQLDYPAMLAQHFGDFAPLDKTKLVAALQVELKDANHISIFATGYGHDGAHLVHRNGYGYDGAILVRPLSGTPRYLLFCFPDQVF